MRPDKAGHEYRCDSASLLNRMGQPPEHIAYLIIKLLRIKKYKTPGNHQKHNPVMQPMKQKSPLHAQRKFCVGIKKAFTHHEHKF
jgi:hypothetical protein